MNPIRWGSMTSFSRTQVTVYAHSLLTCLSEHFHNLSDPSDQHGIDWCSNDSFLLGGKPHGETHDTVIQVLINVYYICQWPH